MNPQEYGTMYGVEDWHWWYVTLRRILKRHWNVCVSKETGLVLDAGCGTGANLVALSEVATPVGVDFFKCAVEFCRMRGRNLTAVASVSSLPFDDGRFDAAVCCDVLTHKAVPNKVAALAEVLRVLRPGGILMVNMPAYIWLSSSHDEAVHTVWRTTRGELTSVLREAGFEIVRARYWNAFVFPAVALLRLWRRAHGRRTDSDLAGAEDSFVNRMMTMLLRVELAVEEYLPVPFGLSVFVVARRPVRQSFRF